MFRVKNYLPEPEQPLPARQNFRHKAIPVPSSARMKGSLPKSKIARAIGTTSHQNQKAVCQINASSRSIGRVQCHIILWFVLQLDNSIRFSAFHSAMISVHMCIPVFLCFGMHTPQVSFPGPMENSRSGRAPGVHLAGKSAQREKGRPERPRSNAAMATAAEKSSPPPA